MASQRDAGIAHGESAQPFRDVRTCGIRHHRGGEFALMCWCVGSPVRGAILMNRRFAAPAADR